LAEKFEKELKTKLRSLEGKHSEKIEELTLEQSKSEKHLAEANAKVLID